MPELPEVETIVRGLNPHACKQQITTLILRHTRLRWPISAHLKHHLRGQTILAIKRRAKYLLFTCTSGTLIIHLGMSGSLRILTHLTPAQKHDHVDIGLANGNYLRFTDPRRFGALLWTHDNPELHPLLATIGPEPLTRAFTGHYLWQRAQGKRVTIKSFIMNSKIVAGVGNIYATEALYLAKIRPDIAAGSINLTTYHQLCQAIKTILRQAISKGGTTLKDFVNSEGKPGYFHLALKAYGKEGMPCPTCQTVFTLMKLHQRATVYCKQCQR